MEKSILTSNNDMIFLRKEVKMMLDKIKYHFIRKSLVSKIREEETRDYFELVRELEEKITLLNRVGANIGLPEVYLAER